MGLLIKNGRVITHTDAGILDGYGIYIEGETIQGIGRSGALEEKYPTAEVIDARQSVVMAGNINGHTHFYGAFARGLAIPGVPPADFPQILKQLWWALDKALDAEAIRLSALVSLVDAIKHGTTTLIDHHASPNHIEGSLDIIAGAMQEAGLRGVLCYEVSDRDGKEKAIQGIAENGRFIREVKGNPLLRGTFGLHASFTLSDETLRQCVEATQGLNTGFHIHVAEHEVDEKDSVGKYGKRVVQRLADLGILGEKSIVAHAVHCDEAELALLRDTQTWVMHQPRSNMNNGVGTVALDQMMEMGLRLGLGTDGFFGSLWEEWKAAYLLQKATHLDPRRAAGDKIAQMGWKHNAGLAQVFFPEQKLGTIAIGAAADIIIVDYYPYTPLTTDNLPWHIIFGFDASMVNTTIVGGRVLMKDRQLLTLDEQAIAEAGREIAPFLWERYQHYATVEDE